MMLSSKLSRKSRSKICALVRCALICGSRTALSRARPHSPARVLDLARASELAIPAGLESATLRRQKSGFARRRRRLHRCPPGTRSATVRRAVYRWCGRLPSPGAQPSARSRGAAQGGPIKNQATEPRACGQSCAKPVIGLGTIYWGCGWASQERCRSKNYWVRHRG
jgi:hypothetical protein